MHHMQQMMEETLGTNKASGSVSSWLYRDGHTSLRAQARYTDIHPHSNK